MRASSVFALACTAVGACHAAGTAILDADTPMPPTLPPSPLFPPFAPGWSHRVSATRAALDNAEIHTISFAAGNPPGPHALLHVGPAKTGTTHLQAFFATNAQRLKSYGWTYPSLFGESCRAQTTARLGGKWSGSLRYVLKPCHQQTQDHEVCGASTIEKERTQLARARQLGRECTNIDSALRRTLATGDDAAVEAVILQWWKDEFARIAQSDAPNLIVSDEAFGNPTYAPLLAHAFKEAGYQRLSAVIVYRTPLLSWARSTYNQHMEGSGPTVEMHLQPPSLLFDEFVPQTVDALAEKLPVVVKAYRDEGFETMVIDLAGAKEKGFDQADVVACDIMRVPFCKESKWRSGTSTGESNSRSDYPNPIGNVAWAYYKAASGDNCSLPKAGERGKSFRAMVSALASAGCLGTQGQAPEYSCTDWAQVENRAVSMEMRWRTSATQVFHSLEKPLTEKIVLCSLNASYLLAKPDAKRVFRAFCTNEQADKLGSVTLARPSHLLEHAPSVCPRVSKECTLSQAHGVLMSIAEPNSTNMSSKVMPGLRGLPGVQLHTKYSAGTPMVVRVGKTGSGSLHDFLRHKCVVVNEVHVVAPPAAILIDPSRSPLIVVTVRNPVARFISSYNMWVEESASHSDSRSACWASADELLQRYATLNNRRPSHANQCDLTAAQLSAPWLRNSHACTGTTCAFSLAHVDKGFCFYWAGTTCALQRRAARGDIFAVATETLEADMRELLVWLGSRGHHAHNSSCGSHNPTMSHASSGQTNLSAASRAIAERLLADEFLLANALVKLSTNKGAASFYCTEQVRVSGVCFRAPPPNP